MLICCWFGAVNRHLESQVWRQTFYMSVWGGRTPKRTTLWSNSRAIRKFSTSGKYRRGRSSNRLPLADKYVDRHGKTRYKGNANLKASQWLCLTGKTLCDAVFCNGYSMTYILCDHPRQYPEGFGRRFARCMKIFHAEKEAPVTHKAQPRMQQLHS